MLKIASAILIVACLVKASSTLFVSADNIKYYLYNSANPTTPVLISRSSVPALVQDATLSVKVVTHGWQADAQVAHILATKSAYLAKDPNSLVIAVDWSIYANNILSSLYVLTAIDVQKVGSYVGETLLAISGVWGIPLEDFHMIGHSLGAHVAGFAGKRIKALTGSRMGRITGLDPAKVGYSDLFPNSRLSSDDANRVDTIHTSTLIAGYTEAIGSIDFYPNGGVSQNGCAFGPCSHNRAPDYFIESISSNAFVATKCTSYNQLSTCRNGGNVQNIMGENVNPLEIGVFYLNTNAIAPYGCGTTC